MLIMFKTTIGLLTLFLLYGCSGTQSKPPAVDGAVTKTHSLAAGNSKKLLFKSTGCKIGEGTLKNEADFASAGSYGTLIVANSTSNATIDKYRVSCAAVAVGASSTCVIQRVEGTGSSRDYGGLHCPDMKFQLVDFRSF
jgi:hypothetical protein